MATYNWSSVLPFSIASALEQTFTDFELLVIGDGCTDDSERVVAAIKDPRVRWINIPRYGHQSGPNNEGLRKARGEYIAYLGHDDLWLPQHLEVLVNALDAGADVAHSTVAVIRTDGSAIPWTLVPTSLMHRRTVTDRIGGWGDYRQLKVLPEVELMDRARAAGVTFQHVKRLTAVKISAAWRRDVYRERPSHEQAAWLARIRSEPDLETTLLVDMVSAPQTPQSMPARIVNFLLRPWRWPAAIWQRMTARRGGVIRKMLQYKGVSD